MIVKSAFQTVFHVVPLTTLKERTYYISIDHERISYDQRFMEMNNQTRELSPIGKYLADQITSTNSNTERKTPVNREENTHEAVNRDTLCVSDKR